jgi:hypothetical protein
MRPPAGRRVQRALTLVAPAADDQNVIADVRAHHRRTV